jgi:hypothetical protein
MGNSGNKPIKTGHFVAQSLLQKWAIAQAKGQAIAFTRGVSSPSKSKRVLMKRTKKMNQQDAVDFRATSLPYGLQRQEDGSYLVLNRMYKPIGFLTDERVKYEEYPIAHHFVRLDEQTIEKLSIPGSRDGDIYLYNDGSTPTIGRRNMKAYLEKLAILMKLDVY